jgi:hypothetical protein
MTPMSFLVALLLVPVAMPVQSPASGQSPPSRSGSEHANPIGTAVLGFKQRVAGYVKLHEAAESKVPKLVETSDQAKVADREAALAAMIKTLRPGAKEGDIFGTDFRAVMEREVRQDFRSRSAADRKAMVQELPAKAKIAVNMTYPSELPLATFPARLLQKLPDLPPELEYRIVGRHIILRDSTANVIVDVARDIVPTIPS